MSGLVMNSGRNRRFHDGMCHILMDIMSPIRRFAQSVEASKYKAKIQVTKVIFIILILVSADWKATPNFQVLTRQIVLENIYVKKAPIKTAPLTQPSFFSSTTAHLINHCPKLAKETTESITSILLPFHLAKKIQRHAV